MVRAQQIDYVDSKLKKIIKQLSVNCWIKRFVYMPLDSGLFADFLYISFD